MYAGCVQLGGLLERSLVNESNRVERTEQGAMALGYHCPYLGADGMVHSLREHPENLKISL